ncbi:DUF3899 domain-containing protein [Oceanobacillus chungangensis]|uniref:DUF3899 domain-containing protein n=1 Tax=Oceanobacillus chungangensis TaxID=1229152 RepID=A0A3D8PY32_9BACI|nr:DUF3899 domain-containing protein [Oceanobacillus chungangensis]RDW20447.1 DUF3899 domain-containing protein [Oceanobacillus chungangensis]
MKNNQYLYLAINLVFASIAFLIFSKQYNFTDFINTLFYISFFYIVIGLFMYIKRGAFFDGITFGFRRFRSVMSRNPDYLEEWKEKPLPSEKKNENFYRFIKFQGISLLIILIILMVIYYLLEN